MSHQDVIAGRDLVMRPRINPDASVVVFAAFGLNRSDADISGDLPDVFVTEGVSSSLLFTDGFE